MFLHFIDLIEYKDGYKFLVKDSVVNELFIFPFGDKEFTPVYTKIVKLVKEKYSLDIQKSDINQLFMFFLMRSNYKKFLNVKNFTEISDFMGALVVGKLDANNDGHKDILISISSGSQQMLYPVL